MSATSPFLVLHRPCDDTVVWAVQKLEQAGLQTVRTFDLQDARLSHPNCLCPNHGTEECTCQMMVMLVYRGNHLPVTLVIHGYDEHSSLYLINTPQQSGGDRLEKQIRDVLA